MKISSEIHKRQGWIAKAYAYNLLVNMNNVDFGHFLVNKQGKWQKPHSLSEIQSAMDCDIKLLPGVDFIGVGQDAWTKPLPASDSDAIASEMIADICTDLSEQSETKHNNKITGAVFVAAAIAAFVAKFIIWC